MEPCDPIPEHLPCDPIPEHLVEYIRGDDSIPDWEHSPNLAEQYIQTLQARYNVAQKRGRALQKVMDRKRKERIAKEQRDAHYDQDPLAGMF